MTKKIFEGEIHMSALNVLAIIGGVIGVALLGYLFYMLLRGDKM
jgi:K+-transporting ATPase, F subunit